jgi:O-antigen ligase
MFSSDLDTVRYPLVTRRWGIVLGCVILVSVAAALVSARTIPFTFAVTAALFVASAVLRSKWQLLVPQFENVTFYLTVFVLYASLSAIWAMEPALALYKTALAILIMLGTMIVSQLIVSETLPDLLHMREGLWIGLLVALLYFLAEIITDQGIKVWIYNTLAISPSDLRPARYFRWADGQLVSIHRDDLARNVAPITPFLWPAVLAMQGTLVRPASTYGAVVLIALASVVVMLSPHETSKLAFVAGLVVFGCARAWPLFSGRLVTVGWVGACLLILPAALIAYRLDLQDASWLQQSARHRIEIWNTTAEKTLQAPFFGVGAHSTYVQAQERGPPAKGGWENRLRDSLSSHAHSVYLQTWYELGLVGATLLTLFGLAILSAIRALSGAIRPYAYATFASAATLAASSYGMWQIWYMALFGFSAVLFSLGRNTSTARDA